MMPITLQAFGRFQRLVVSAQLAADPQAFAYAVTQAVIDMERRSRELAPPPLVAGVWEDYTFVSRLVSTAGQVVETVRDLGLLPPVFRHDRTGREFVTLAAAKLAVEAMRGATAQEKHS